MIKQVNSILVPVDFSENTAVAISKALELFSEKSVESTIHLLHVQRTVISRRSFRLSTFLSGYTQQQVNSDLKCLYDRLEELKRGIEKNRIDVKVLCWVGLGKSVQETIIKKAMQLSVDMIIIGKRSHHNFLSLLNTVIPSKLASATDIPVLTAKPGSLHQEIRTVVIPVGSEVPVSKFEVLGMLKKGARPHVRLVAFNNDFMEQADPKQALLYTFRAFKNRFSYTVNYEVLDGNYRALALLRYCDKVGADVLIVYPGAETRVGSWAMRNISDFLPPKSKTQILAITPA